MFNLVNALPTAVLVGLVGIATGAATYAGGALALRLRTHIRLILGFSAGAVIGVALFDLLPEAMELGQRSASIREVAAFVSAGFVGYLLLDRLSQILAGGSHSHRGHLGAGSLTIHSLLDGLGIGLAFKVSAPVGVVLAVAVLAHDFSDGINTVNLSLTGAASPRTARRWLIADALAPLVGIAVAQMIVVDRSQLALLLATFTGVFLYIGASELIPDSHEQHPHLWTTLATVIGMALIYVAVQLASL